MPDIATHRLARRWVSATEAVEAKLADLIGREPDRLGADVLTAYRGGRGFVGGWRLGITFSDGVERRMDVALGLFFPESLPRIVLVDHPPRLTWPHVESDGVLCLLPNEAEFDPDDPAGVVMNLLAKGCRLVEELIQGEIVARDFREEFLTYWAYDINFAQACLHSLVTPCGPTRPVRLWRGKQFNVLAETDASLTEWVNNRFGGDRLMRVRTEEAAFIWLPEPLMPSQYPQTAADFRALAAEGAPSAVPILDGLASRLPDQIVAIIGAEGRAGPGLVSVTIPRPGATTVGRHRRLDPLTRGYRPNSVPSNVASARFFASEPVRRSGVFRADAAWIHGRGQEPRTERLLASTVTVIGCGSVGGPVAVTLAQTGVGTLRLVDHDDSAWANVGRHPLGAKSVGKNKALELAAELRAAYPHLTITGHNSVAQALAVHGELLIDADLVVSATGNWAAEGALDDWHRVAGRFKPVLYGWTEAHAGAGHGVAILSKGGCLHCGLGRTGVPTLQVTTWPDGGTGVKEEPACGEHYQPYGPIEIGFTNIMVAELAVDVLLGRVQVSTHRLWCSRRAYLESVGGQWSAEWAQMHAGRLEGGFVDEQPWYPAGCARCAQVVVAA